MLVSRDRCDLKFNNQKIDKTVIITDTSFVYKLIEIGK